MGTTVFHIEGGIGKNVAATAVITAYKKAKPKRKIIVVSAWPEVWINNPHIARFYRIGNTPYFYQDVIKQNRDNIITADSGGDFISGSGSSYDSETGGTFGSSVDDASTFSDYS